MNENREAIKAKFPGMGVADFGKKCGELWKELADKKVGSLEINLQKITLIAN